MRFTVAATAALVSSAAAAPWGPGGGWFGRPNPGKCLTADSAQYLVNGFEGLISAYTDANADKLLADDFSDYSDSINSLAASSFQVMNQKKTSTP